MNRTLFYGALRRDKRIFGSSLSQRQVDGIEALLDALHGFPLDHAANVLGQVFIETGGGMYPVKETVFPHSKNKNPTDAAVIKRLDRAYAKGQLPWVRTPYWREGWFGRGVIQLTHESNYRRMSAVVGMDLVRHPEKALDLKVSAKIAAEGMSAGLFTGQRLADYDRPEGYDHRAARGIVNGDVKTKGPALAKYAGAFADALREAGWQTEAPVRPDAAPAVEIPDTPKGKGTASLIAMIAAGIAVAVASGWDWITNIFGG